MSTRELHPLLPQQAWAVLNSAFVEPAESGGEFPNRITATDGAEWMVFYLEFETGPSVSLVRFVGDEIVSYELIPKTQVINIARTTKSSSFQNALESLQFQEKMGTYIPTGDDLRPLEEFLLPG